MSKEHKVPFGMMGIFLAIGIVYGDIGTSPLYVMKAIVDSLPDGKFPGFKSKINRDIRRLEKFLNKKDFFDLVSTSEMDYRALELKLSKFIMKIDPDISDILFPCHSEE